MANFSLLFLGVNPKRTIPPEQLSLYTWGRLKGDSCGQDYLWARLPQTFTQMGNTGILLLSPPRGSPCFSSVASITLVITCLASVCFSRLCAVSFSAGYVHGWVPSTGAACLGHNKCLLGKQINSLAGGTNARMLFGAAGLGIPGGSASNTLYDHILPV